jgi:hypothetical protein
VLKALKSSVGTGGTGSMGVKDAAAVASAPHRNHLRDLLAVAHTLKLAAQPPATVAAGGAVMRVVVALAGGDERDLAA